LTPSPSVYRPSPPHAARAPRADGDRLARTIGIARILCILGIVYVHAWTGRTGEELVAMNDTPQAMLRWVLIDLLGRSAVPLLSIISGWLVGGSLARRGRRPFIKGKARTILGPMVAWNALSILLVSGAAYAGLIEAPTPRTLWWTIDELFCLATPNDINVQTAFLRDLFVCMVAVPLLVRLPNRALWAIAAVALVWSVSGVVVPLLLRPSILSFFVLGLLARRHDSAVRLAALPIGYVAGAYFLCAAFQFWMQVTGIDRGLDDPVLLASADIVMRFVTALFFWTIAWRLANGRFAAALLRIEPYMFLMFCAHLIMIWLGGPLIGRFTGPLGSALYVPFLLVQPLLVLGATILLGGALRRTVPAAAAWLSGRRLLAGPAGRDMERGEVAAR
jgi:hypothetical protein